MHTAATIIIGIILVEKIFQKLYKSELSLVIIRGNDNRDIASIIGKTRHE